MATAFAIPAPCRGSRVNLSNKVWQKLVHRAETFSRMRIGLKRKPPGGSKQYAYQGPLGQVVDNGWYFFAWRDGFLVGTYHTLEQALESLAWRERLKTRESE